MTIIDLAFKTTFTPYQKLVLLGQTIPAAHIKTITPLHAELDYPDLTTFNIGNVTITLFDPEGRYNPNNPHNFWTQHSDNQTGYKSAIEIHIGYRQDGSIEAEKVFQGEVTNIRANLQPPEIVIDAVDASQTLRPAEVDDFGIQRRIVLPEAPEHATYSGRYPFPTHSVPSHRSVKAVTSITHDDMTDIGTISTEGTASPLNYQIKNNILETEGGPLHNGNLPIATYKDIYRYKRIDTLLKKLLAHYDITDYHIDIPEQHTDTPHYASLGRPGWELENLPDTDPQPWHWDGYVKDVKYDAENRKYYMLYGQQSEFQPDWLISYDVASDSWQRIATTNTQIGTFTREYEMWQLATDDYDTFYILATVYQTEGRSRIHGGGIVAPGTYDALETAPNSPITILKYVRTTNTWTKLNIAPENRPQIGHYYSAFPQPTSTRYPMLPDNRSGFAIKTTSDAQKQLFYVGYRGIHTINLKDASQAIFKTIPTDSRRATDFHLGDTDENTYVAWIEEINNYSVIKVEDGTGQEVINQRIPDIGTRQAITISDLIYHNETLYAVIQVMSIQHVQGDPIQQISRGNLIKIDISNGTVENIQAYSDFLHAPRSPVVHKNAVYYFTGSHYQYQRPNTVDGRDREVAPTATTNTGNLIKINGSTITDLGLCWRSAFQNPLQHTNDANIGYGRHGGTASPMHTDGQNINFWAGYGNLNNINAHPTNDINNWHWLRYGTQLTHRIPAFHTNDKKAWELINELARLTNATINYRNGQFRFAPRTTRQTTLTQNLTKNSTTAQLENTERFDNTGLVLINDELIAYTAKQNNTELTGLTRGSELSQPTTHKKGDTVLFVDALVFNHPDKKNLASLKVNPDFHGIYNSITAKLTPIAGEKAEISIQNTDSIHTNGEKHRNFNFDILTWHERPWAETLLNAYLNEMQHAQHEVNLELPWSPHLKLGQTLVVDQQHVAHLRWTPVRILRIAHDFNARTTRITARTFGQPRITETALRFDADITHHRIYIIDEPIHQFVLPQAKGGLGNITYTLSQLPPGLVYTPASRNVLGTPTTLGTTIMTYTATASPQTTTLKFRITVVPPLSFTADTPQYIVYQQGCYIQHQLPEATGGIGRRTYTLDGLPHPLKFNPNTRTITGIVPNTDSCLSYKVKDTAGNTQEQTFDLIRDTPPTWRAIFITGDQLTAVDSDSHTARAFNINGTRTYADPTGTLQDINLGNGSWRGATATDNRKIFVDKTGKVKLYDMDNTEQTAEAFTLGTGDWQDVTHIGTNKLGFLDRQTAAVRIYTTAGVPQPAEDIVFPYRANYRSIAYYEDTNGDAKLAVLIEDIGMIFIWDIASAAFQPDSAIVTIPGSRNWQSICRHPDGHLLLTRANSPRLIAFTHTPRTRDPTKDIPLL